MALLSCLFSTALVAAFVGFVQGDEFRTWSDVTGRFSVYARLVGVEQNFAILQREDGVKVVVEINKLAQADRTYVENISAQNPFILLEETPRILKEHAPIVREKSSERIERATTSEMPTLPRQPSRFKPYFFESNQPVVIDWSKVKSIFIEPGIGWSLTVPEVTPVSISARSLDLFDKGNLFERVTALVVNPLLKKAVVRYTMTRPGSAEKSHKLLLINLEGRTGVASFSLTDNVMPLAIYPTLCGQEWWLLSQRDDFGFGNQDRLFLQAFRATGESGPEVSRASMPGFSWLPYENLKGAARDVRWADFPDERTLVTCSGMGLIVIWDLANMQPKASLQTTMGHIPALSLDRRWLAFAMTDQIGILDIEKQQVIALQKMPRSIHFPTLAFSPSGRKLACLTNQRNLAIWDVASGNLEADFTLPSGIVFQEKLLFPHEDFLLGGNRYLFHWKSQLLVWEYTNLEAAVSIGDLTCCVTSQGREGAGNPMKLLLAQIPHAAALQLLDAALNNLGSFAFRAGSPVKLDVSAIPEDARDKVYTILTERLEQMGCKITDTAKVSVVAGVSGPKEQTVSYWHSGDYKVKQYHLWIKILAEDELLWETSASGGVPFVIFLKPGENVGSKLQELTDKPNYDWFKTVALPQYLQRVPAKGSLALGRGALTIDN
ncbi:MAG: SHD1 domain-containing protein [Thermogutta sp.]